MTHSVKWFSNERKKPKYHNKATATGGIIYHSKKESKYAQDLEFRKKAGDIKDWKRQVRLDLRAYGKHICYYAMDFIVEHNDGTFEMVEVKGFATDVWRLKWALLEAMNDAGEFNEQYPGLKLTVMK